MSTPPAPRAVGDPQKDILAIVAWASALYKELVSEQRVIKRLNTIKAIEPLDLAISASPTQAQVEAVRDKVNEIIAAAQ